MTTVLQVAQIIANLSVAGGFLTGLYALRKPHTRARLDQALTRLSKPREGQ